MQTGLSIKNSFYKTGASNSAKKNNGLISTNNNKSAISASRRSEIKDLQNGNADNVQIINGKKTYIGKSKVDVLQSSSLYSQALNSQRTANQKTQTTVKKLKYSFKAISSKLLRSKTSVSARQVASQAKREVQRLKNLKKSDGYDAEELEAAITHAKAMERLAKKKARHLQEEEMAKIGGNCIAEVMEKQEQEKEDKLSDEEMLALNYDDTEYYEELDSEQYQGLDLGNIEELEAYYQETEAIMDELGEAMMEDMGEAMSDIMEELGLDELLEDITGNETDMDPADLKMMKIKHRSREMKDLAKADAEYLKAIFKMLEQQKSSGSSSIPGTSNIQSAGFINMAGTTTTPEVKVEAVHIDVSL